jgi:serine/threonine-protein kinase HipA
MTYSFNPEGLWTGTHQMTLNGKRKDFVLEDFKACARSAMMKRGRAERILSEVLEVTSKWPDYADKAGVPQPTARKIQNAMRLDGFP